MATGRRKCICQICTCGKHICPHRKRGTLAIKGLQNGELCKHGSLETEEDNLDKTEIKETTVVSSYANGRNGSGQIKVFKAKKVQGKGNGKGRWSAKQVPKTMAIKHSDNLKMEGSFEHMTIQQQDYTEKSMTVNGVSVKQSQTQQDVSRKDSWSKRQIPKTLPIKNPDNLKPSGSLDLRTTHGEAFTDLTPVEASQRNKELGETLNGDRKIRKNQKQQRPKTSLRPGGAFQTETLYQKDFSPRKPTLSPKHKPTNHLKPEGQMYFEPTSLDYNADVFRATAADDGQLISPRPRKVRPQSNLKTALEPIATETTVGTDYKKWNVEKPARRRPEDTLKWSPTPQSVEEEELLEQIKQDKYDGDYKVWNVRRPIVQKPPSNLRSEGEFNFETTHHSDYIIREEKDEIIRGDEEIIAAAQEEQVNGEDHILVQEESTEHIPTPEDSIIAEMKSDITSPDIQPTSDMSKGASPIENEGEIALSEVSSADKMLTWDEIRPQPIRPHSNLRQDGDMKFDTTNRREFIQRPIERVKGFRPQTSTKISEDMMDMTTTNQAMLKGYAGERVNPIRPKSNLHIEEGYFNDETTSAREYQQWVLDKPKPIVHKSTLGQEGDMTFTTTHHTEFEPKSPERVYPVRPKTSNKIFNGHEKFDGTTTNRVMHPKYESEKIDSIRPETNLKPNSGSFNGETTNKREFQQWKFDKMTPFRPSTSIKQEGDMDFTTMNQVQFQDLSTPRERIHPVVHSTNLHVESGQFSDDTTTNREFQEWKLEKLTPFTPKDNLNQEGDFDFTTVNQTQYFEKPIERVVGIKPKSSSKITGDFDGTTTNQVMFQHLSGERPEEIRPKTNMKVEGGDFDGTTTNQAMFKSHPYQKLQETRPHSNLHVETGKFENDTTTGREFHEWKYSKPSPFLPHGNLMPEGEMQFTTSNEVEFGEKHVERVEGVRPHTTDITTGDFDGMTTNRSTFKTPTLEKMGQIRHADNIQMASGAFNGETTAGREFVYRSSERPEPVKPKPNLSTEGDFDFKTSNQRDYEGKSVTKVVAIRPTTMTKISEGDFYGTTTNQAMYGGEGPYPIRAKRPQTNIGPINGELYNNAVAREQYQSWRLERPAPVIYKDTLKHDGSMQFETTNRAEFVGRSGERPEAIRPKTTTKIEGDLDVTTTNQVMYTGRPLEKVQPIRQKDNLHLESGKFSDETTSKREFRQWVRSQPRTKVVKPLKAAGVRTQTSVDKSDSNLKTVETEGKIFEETAEDINEIPAPSTENGLSHQNSEELDGETKLSDETIVETTHKTETAEKDGGVQQRTRKQHSRSYGSKPMARVKAIRPIESMKQEGTIDFSTTSGNAFTEKLEQSKLDNIRFKSDYEPWKLCEDGDGGISQKNGDIPTRPVIHKRGTINGSAMEGSTTTQASYKVGQVVKAPKRFKPDDNLKTENVPFDADSTTRTEFKKWEATKASSKKRSSMLKQEGEMQFSTTAEDYSKEFFEQNGRVKIRQKPQEHLKLTGDIDLSTTTQSVYQGNATPRTKTLRPKSSLKIGGDPDSRTGTPPSSFRQKLTTDVTKTTSQVMTERTRSTRPTTSQKVGEGQFEHLSTTQKEYRAVKMDKPKAFKPQSSHIFNGGGEFQGNSTYRCAYDALQGIRCPVLDLESNAKYRFKEEVNGHRFYLPLVIG